MRCITLLFISYTHALANRCVRTYTFDGTYCLRRLQLPGIDASRLKSSGVGKSVFYLSKGTHAHTAHFTLYFFLVSLVCLSLFFGLLFVAVLFSFIPPPAAAPSETPKNKRLAQELIEKWSRPLFQLSDRYTGVVCATCTLFARVCVCACLRVPHPPLDGCVLIANLVFSVQASVLCACGCVDLPT